VLERRQGELRVLQLLEAAFEPADTPIDQCKWIAYYGKQVRQLTAPGRAARGSGVPPPSKNLCEVDFIVISRDRGLMVIEVKGGRLRTRPDGDWEQSVPGGAWSVCDDPILQADAALRALGDRTSDSMPEGHSAWRRIWRVPAVVLPFSAPMKCTLPSGWAPQLVATDGECVDHATFERWIESAFSYVRDQFRRMLSEDCARATCDIEQRVLFPNFRADVNVQAQINRLEREDGKTASSFPYIYDFVRSRRRRRVVRVEGAAGTGKTYAGLVRAREMLTTEPDARCLFVCHNRMLAQLVSRSFLAGFGERFKALTFEDLAREKAAKAGISLPSSKEVAQLSGEEQRLFYESLGQTLIDSLSILSTTGQAIRYSLIVVDEAQDLSDKKLEALAALAGDHALLWVTYDTAQSIFATQESKEKWRDRMDAFGDPDVLARMCRCSMQVVDYLRRRNLIAETDVDFDPGAPEGMEVREFEVTPDVVAERMVDEVLHLRNEEGLELSDMIVQIARKLDNQNSPLHAATDGGSRPISLKGQGQLVPCTELPDGSSPDVPIVTLQMFKGCERPYVIVICDDWMQKRMDFLYVALTRARIGATVFRVVSAAKS
jgi:hypothetical protein